MQTLTIKSLEYDKAILIAQLPTYNPILNENELISIRLKIKNIEENIRAEQIELWNYYLKTSISASTIDELVDIIQYFDQLNYKDHLYDKILNELAQLSSSFDCYLEEGDERMMEMVKNQMEMLQDLMRGIYQSESSTG